ncbi:hypothetical protein QN362_07695 [Actimicrobium sp. CCC2.4]|uniref:hypothetical protein n=1 Tax=Actimicrobium sp. CCC2.4 TaxID=3048606 RepID=UPI002AC91A8B|nr:hypothetical protein [Actimicrobium sp. CCC2.4]MEB0135211.1 hypothetical protein [Actimicrobium sp. CCC2.4]WPX31007.1 hypothetical protein RHM62_12155 [Actimicrobium sp. CCC2.4]
MQDAINTIKWTALATLLLSALSIDRPAFGSPESERMIEVQHVRLVSHFLQTMANKTIKANAESCALHGMRLPEAPPASIIKDVYYTPGATTIATTNIYYEATVDCKLKQRETHEITAWTSLGACTTKPERNLSAGYCDVDFASLGQFPDQKFKRNQTELKGASTMIAGHACTFYENSAVASRRVCVARDGAFSKVTNLSFSDTPLGVILKRESKLAQVSTGNSLTEEAIEIHTNVMIPITTLLPQLSGKYRVISQKLPPTDSPQ